MEKQGYCGDLAVLPIQPQESIPSDIPPNSPIKVPVEFCETASSFIPKLSNQDQKIYKPQIRVQDTSVNRLQDKEELRRRAVLQIKRAVCSCTSRLCAVAFQRIQSIVISKNSVVSLESQFPKVLSVLERLNDHTATIKSAFDKISIYSQRRHIFDRAVRLLEIKIHRFLSIPFWRIKVQSIKKDSNPSTNLKDSLWDLRNLLKFDALFSLSSKSCPDRNQQQVDRNSQMRVVTMKKQIRCLKENIKNLKVSLQEISELRERDTQKKYDGLRLLADEMQQKDQLISQLEQQLEFQRSISQGKMNVKADVKSLLMENQKFKALNQKLSNVLESFKTEKAEEVKRLQEQISSLKSNQRNIINQLRSAKQLSGDLEQQINQHKYEEEQLRSFKQELDQRQLKISSKLYDLTCRQIECDQVLKTFTNISKTANSKSPAEDKLEIIKQLLARHKSMMQTHNSTFQNYTGQDPQDRSELLPRMLEIIDVMLDHSVANNNTLELTRNNNLSQSLSSDPRLFRRVSKLDLHRLKQIEGKILSLKNQLAQEKANRLTNNTVSSFHKRKIFGVANHHTAQNRTTIQATTRNYYEENSEVGYHPVTNRPNNAVTMRMMELQIQRNKYQQNLLTLKQRNLYVRNMVLQFLKCLDLRQSIHSQICCMLIYRYTFRTMSKQCEDTLGFLMDMFQYSEEEKEQIFRQSLQTQKTGLLGYFMR